MNSISCSDDYCSSYSSSNFRVLCSTVSQSTHLRGIKSVVKRGLIFYKINKVIYDKYKANWICFQTFFVWALLLIIHTRNSCPLRSNFLRLQCTCCTVTTTSARANWSPLLWACQWPSSHPLSSPQLSHNDSRWA